MKFYVASSWRNNVQPDVVMALRALGHEVYDFKNPPNKAGFQWEQVTRGNGRPTLETYADSLKHPDAVAGFNADFDAMKWADACVLVLPCNRSAHLEAGWFWGQGKPLYILLCAEQFEPELMYMGATAIVNTLGELLDKIGAADAN